MNTSTSRRRHARPGAVAAGVAVAVGLAAAVGLLWAGDGMDGEHLASGAKCAPLANQPFAAS